jgi:hypothetical protein
VLNNLLDFKIWGLLVQFCLFIQVRTAAFKAYRAILVRRSNFRHQASPRVSPRESTQRGKVELWARNDREFCLNSDLHVVRFRNLIHAVKLRHGTDGFTPPPKEGVLTNWGLLVQICLFIQVRTAALRLIVRSWLDVPTFATRRLHACQHARVPSGGRWNCGREMTGNFA